MYEFLIHAHSGLRWICLILLIAAIGMAFAAGTKPFIKNRKIYLFAMVSTHLQLVVGLILYFISVKGPFGIVPADGVMSDPTIRFFSVEHTIAAVVGIALITIGWSRAKRKDNERSKHRAVAVFYLIGLLIILSRIPWPFMKDLGAGWV